MSIDIGKRCSVIRVVCLLHPSSKDENIYFPMTFFGRHGACDTTPEITKIQSAEFSPYSLITVTSLWALGRLK